MYKCCDRFSAIGLRLERQGAQGEKFDQARLPCADLHDRLQPRQQTQRLIPSRLSHADTGQASGIHNQKSGLIVARQASRRQQES